MSTKLVPKAVRFPGGPSVIFNLWKAPPLKLYPLYSHLQSHMAHLILNPNPEGRRGKLAEI